MTRDQFVVDDAERAAEERQLLLLRAAELWRTAAGLERAGCIVSAETMRRSALRIVPIEGRA